MKNVAVLAGNRNQFNGWAVDQRTVQNCHEWKLAPNNGWLEIGETIYRHIARETSLRGVRWDSFLRVGTWYNVGDQLADLFEQYEKMPR